MRSDDRLDLSPLDPSSDPEHWHRFKEQTLRRVDAVLRRRVTHPFDLIASWSTRLTLAAVTIVVLLLPVEMMLDAREAGVTRIEQLVQLSTAAARGEGNPTGEELSRTLLDRGGR